MSSSSSFNRDVPTVLFTAPADHHPRRTFFWCSWWSQNRPGLRSTAGCRRRRPARPGTSQTPYWWDFPRGHRHRCCHQRRHHQPPIGPGGQCRPAKLLKISKHIMTIKFIRRTADLPDYPTIAPFRQTRSHVRSACVCLCGVEVCLEFEDLWFEFVMSKRSQKRERQQHVSIWFWICFDRVDRKHRRQSQRRKAK